MRVFYEEMYFHFIGEVFLYIMFTPAIYFLLESPWRIIIPNLNVNSHSL
jgi:hypothetical protein